MKHFRAGEFFGESKSSMICGAVLSEVRYASARELEHHGHLCAHFNLLLKGSYSEIVNGSDVPIDPLSLVFNGPLTEHSETIGNDGMHYFMVELGAEWLGAMASFGKVPTHFFEFYGGDASWLALRVYKAFRHPPLDSTFMIESLLYELCACLQQDSADVSKEPRWLRQVMSEVQERFNERLQLRTLAQNAGVDPSHLARTFHRHYGRPIGDYVARLRAQYVGQRVVQTSETLKMIALDAGFADQSHMSRVFKEISGVAPDEYRRLMRTASFISCPQIA